jgi:5-dehydro-2-deoxygluconokinase
MLSSLNRTRPLAAITLGRAGMDLYPDPDGTRIVDADRFAADVGGAGGNIAVAVARQGPASALVTSFSDDAVGRFVRARLERYGVDTSRCGIVAGERRTSLALAETRAADCEVVIYRNGAADLQAAGKQVDPAFIAHATTLIVTGTSLAADSSRAMAMAALVMARDAGTFTVLDIDHRPYSWKSDATAAEAYLAAARMSDAVVGNIDEFDLLAEGGAARAAARLIEDGCDFVVLKRGATGSTTFTAEGAFETGVFAVTAKKPFGAGDAFLGGLVAALVRSDPLPDAVKWGSAAAAIVVSRRGCASAMPTFEEVRTMISDRATTASS